MGLTERQRAGVIVIANSPTSYGTLTRRAKDVVLPDYGNWIVGKSKRELPNSNLHSRLSRSFPTTGTTVL